jgi:hypothetical protein
MAIKKRESQSDHNKRLPLYNILAPISSGGVEIITPVQ